MMIDVVPSRERQCKSTCTGGINFKEINFKSVFKQNYETSKNEKENNYFFTTCVLFHHLVVRKECPYQFLSGVVVSSITVSG